MGQMAFRRAPLCLAHVLRPDFMKSINIFNENNLRSSVDALDLLPETGKYLLELIHEDAGNVTARENVHASFIASKESIGRRRLALIRDAFPLFGIQPLSKFRFIFADLVCSQLSCRKYPPVLSDLLRDGRNPDREPLL